MFSNDNKVSMLVWLTMKVNTFASVETPSTLLCKLTETPTPLSLTYPKYMAPESN